jgi:hypothetical protein
MFNVGTERAFAFLGYLGSNLLVWQHKTRHGNGRREKSDKKCEGKFPSGTMLELRQQVDKDSLGSSCRIGAVLCPCPPDASQE